jgi:hypothetical protein
MARRHYAVLLTGGTLKRYIEELPVTGLTSTPALFERATANMDFFCGNRGGRENGQSRSQHYPLSSSWQTLPGWANRRLSERGREPIDSTFEFRRRAIRFSFTGKATTISPDHS